MTGSKHVKWNLFLPHFSVIYSFLTFLLIIFCQVIIKMFFKLKKTAVKQRYKSILSFKVLRAILGIFIILALYISLTFLDYFCYDKRRLRSLAIPAPFIIILVGIAILLTYLLANEDARSYLRMKIKILKDEITLRLELRRVRNVRKKKKVHPATALESLRRVSIKKPHRGRSNSVYLIDLKRGHQDLVAETSF